MDPQELTPLEAGVPQPPPRAVRCRQGSPRVRCRGPLKICRLVAMIVMLPGLLVTIPLYLRYRVYSGQMYPMSMTDMRLIDSKISPTWCQRQVVRSNATFNAFVVPHQPELSENLVPVSMTRQLELEDDMKEYWGFYLLKGSSVTVSACTRWPGASLILIKGYKHLKECAYIGDDSSEELDELITAYELGLLTNDTLQKKLEVLKDAPEGKTNHPGSMKRHKAGVSFHDPSNVENYTSPDATPPVDDNDHDPKELRKILEDLHDRRQAIKNEHAKHYKPPDHLISLPALHRHRDTNVDKDQRRWLFFKDLDGKNSEQVNSRELQIPVIRIDTNKSIKFDLNTNKSKVVALDHNYLGNGVITPKNVEEKIIDKELTEKERDKSGETNKTQKLYGDSIITILKQKNEAVTKTAIQKSKEITESIERNGKETVKDIKNVENSNYTVENITNQEVDAESANSKEVFEEVLQKLQDLGDRGKRVLKKLQETMGVKEKGTKEVKTNIMSTLIGSEEELDRLRKVLVEAIDEEKTRSQRQQKRHDARTEARAKRELMLGQIELQKEFNEDDEPRNLAAEEDFRDEHANIHEHVNETTAFDMSNSEFWSSFSSSEEALLECEGLILNLPLTPHSGCHKGASEEESLHAARANALTYRVPANGYYFFVFNSENEVQTNFIRAKFDMQKTRYDVAQTKLRECLNSTDRCDLSLDIFTSQKVVLEVPLRNNDSLWNEQFVIISECEPRTSIYLVCVIAVPVLILIFGFQ